MHLLRIGCASLLGCLYAEYSWASPMPIPLGTAGSFGVLAGSTVTNTGSSVIHGDIGLSPGSAVTGFPPGIVVGGTIHAGDQSATQAQADLASAYIAAAAQPSGVVLSGQDLGGLTLTPGVYTFASAAQLTGTLTLSGGNASGAVFLFQIGTTLTTATASSILLMQGASGANVFWQVGSSATLGVASEFSGTILAAVSITLDTGASIGCGRALARNGAVALDDNAVAASTCQATVSPTGVPETGSALLLATASLIAGFWTRLARYGWSMSPAIVAV